MDEASGDVASDLVDLSGVDFSQIDSLDLPILAASLRRILVDAHRGERAAAGFNSSI